MKKRARLITFYLPQYHPTKANDNFWGKGFTEWTNVTKAKPMFPGHLQPKLPSLLGFYDLRIPEIRQMQADLASTYGIEGFCYWHYWFGDGERTLERVFQEVLSSNKPDFPFCLAWANESWTGKWHGLDDKYIFKQKYLGKRDFKNHFYNVLPAFKDSRYLTIEGRPIFLVYRPKAIEPEPKMFVDIWQNLAVKEGLKDIYFIGVTEDWNPMEHGFNKIVSNAPNWNHSSTNLHNILIKKANINLPELYSYKRLVQSEKIRYYKEYELPVVVTNWDNTPRAGKRGKILLNSSPSLYKEWLNYSIETISNRKFEDRIIFIKSWNEWAEGNYLEPDRNLGLKMLEATKQIIHYNE